MSLRTLQGLEAIYSHSSCTDLAAPRDRTPAAAQTHIHMDLLLATTAPAGWHGPQITEKLLTFGNHSSFFPLTSPFSSFHVVTCCKQSMDCASLHLTPPQVQAQ